MVQEPSALKQQWEHQQSTEKGLISVRGGNSQPGGGWGAAFRDNSMEMFQRGVERCPCPSDRQRSSHSFRQELKQQSFEQHWQHLGHALSQERGAARAAMQNLTDTSADKLPACADHALAGGDQHHWSSAQRGEAAGSSLCLSHCT